MKIEVFRRSLDDLCAGSKLPFDDPHGLCRINEKMLAAFRTNPIPQRQDGLAQLVGTVDGCAAGTLMFLLGEIVVDDEVFPITWCSGLYVVPEFRKTLLGIMLIKEARQSSILVGGSRVGDAAYPIFQRLGWHGIPLQRYILASRSRPIVERALGPGRAASVLTPVVDLALVPHRWYLKGRKKLACADLHCKPAEAVPESLDPALAKLPRPFGCPRSSRWLNWILQNTFDPDLRNCKQLFLVENREGRVVAYFVTRVKFQERVSDRGFRDLTVGSVLDWAVFDPLAVSEEHLWLMATDTLTSAGVDVVEICDMSPEAAVPFGFRRFGEHRMVLFSNPGGPTITNHRARNWKFRQIDGDAGLG